MRGRPEETDIELPAGRTDPLAPPDAYAELRRRHPVAWAGLPGGGRCWVVTRFAEARSVLLDTRFSSDNTKPGFPVLSPRVREIQELMRQEGGDLHQGRNFMIRTDRPDHTPFRALFMRHFTARAIRDRKERWRPGVDALVDGLERQEEPDFVAHVAQPAALHVMNEVLGVPPGDQEQLERCVRSASLNTPEGEEDEAEVQRGLDGVFDYFLERVREAEKDPGEGLIDDLVRDNTGGRPISHEDVAGTLQAMLMDGFQVTSNVPPLGLLLLHRHREQADLLRSDPGLLPSAVNEVLRYISIADLAVARVADEDMELAGHTIRAGEGVMVLGACANHDEDAFPEPEKFDVTRDPTKHLDFGYGWHQCLGQFLAKVEIEVIFASALERKPFLRPASDIEALPFRHGHPLYGVDRLPVTW